MRTDTVLKNLGHVRIRSDTVLKNLGHIRIRSDTVLKNLGQVRMQNESNLHKKPYFTLIFDINVSIIQKRKAQF